MSELKGLGKQEVSFVISSFVQTLERGRENLKKVKQKKDVLYNLGLLQNYSKSIDIGLSNEIARVKLYVINSYSAGSLDQQAVSRIKEWYDSFSIELHTCISLLPQKEKVMFMGILKVLEQKMGSIEIGVNGIKSQLTQSTNHLESHITSSTQKVTKQLSGLEKKIVSAPRATASRVTTPRVTTPNVAAPKKLTVNDYWNRALSHKRQGAYTQAISALNEAINLKSTFSKAYLERGNIKLILGSLGEAIKDFQRTVELDPTNKRAYELKVNARQRLIEEQPFNEQLLHDLINDFTEVIRDNPRQGKYFLLRAKQSFKVNNFNQAYADAKQARQLSVSDKEIDEIIYKSLIGLGRIDNEFLTHLNKAISNGLGVDGMTFYQRGLFYFNNNKFNGAIKDFERCKGLASKNYSTKELNQMIDKAKGELWVQENLNSAIYEAFNGQFSKLKKILEINNSLSRLDWIEKKINKYAYDEMVANNRRCDQRQENLGGFLKKPLKKARYYLKHKNSLYWSVEDNRRAGINGVEHLLRRIKKQFPNLNLKYV